MKRKLDANDEPTQAVAAAAAESSTAHHSSLPDVTFADLGLDPRLLQAVAEHKFHAPTLVQKKAIPAALDGQDVLAKARTGSGKTAAYVLPVLQAILKRKAVSIARNAAPPWRAPSCPLP
jgi:ATP-dependent RNA helicase DDX56/DBP9